MTSLRLALAQLNTTVGDFRANHEKIAAGIRRAQKNGASLIVFPELAVAGYPPEDLLFKKSFIDAGLDSVKSLVPLTRSLTALVGFVDRDGQGRLYNAVAVLSGGKWTSTYRKIELPNYGVFDEKRYFTRGQDGLLLETGRHRIGVSVCEDIWQVDSFVYRPPYKGQTSLIINLSASPYHIGKLKVRHDLVRTLARETGAAVAYLNLVGGQDELVFDGGSFVMSPQGRLLAQAACLEEDFLVADIKLPPHEGHMFTSYADPYRAVALETGKEKKRPLKTIRAPRAFLREEEVYRALVLGTRDYVHKNGFKKVLIGLSGGIDSALVAQIAVDALGAQSVVGVTMPSCYTSKGTFSDAQKLAKNLRIRLLELSIEKTRAIYLDILKPVFGSEKPGLAEENLQARIRGNYLMALSNRFGYLVLTTGNKSEMATGYCTLYGDMAGGFAVIKDVTKTLVYQLARWRNRRERKALIPESTIRRAPSAELRHNQKDQDSLPPYAALDRVLERYIEEDRSPEEIVREGFSKALVQKIVRLVDRNEYKRRQAPPGVKITPKAFGRDRRMPLTSRFGT